MADFAIRDARAGDVPEIVALVTDVLAEFEIAFGIGSTTDDQLRNLPGSYAAAGGAFWIARARASANGADGANHTAGVLLGTAGVFLVAPGAYELRKMYLRPAARGLGVGAKLLDAAVAWTRAAGGTHLVLDTVEQMTRAIAFYEAHGFVRDDAQVRGARCTRGYALDLRIRS